VILTLRLVIQLLLPPLFDLACGLTRLLLESLNRWIRLSTLQVILLSVAGWTGLALSTLPLFLAHGWVEGRTWVILLGVGCVLGLCIAGRVAREWVAIPSVLIRPDPAQVNGIHPHMVASGEDPPQAMTWEELSEQGVVLGARVGERRKL
jgi:hypothetical protein